MKILVSCHRNSEEDEAEEDNRIETDNEFEEEGSCYNDSPSDGHDSSISHESPAKDCRNETLVTPRRVKKKSRVKRIIDSEDDDEIPRSVNNKTKETAWVGEIRYGKIDCRRTINKDVYDTHLSKSSVVSVDEKNIVSERYYSKDTFQGKFGDNQFERPTSVTDRTQTISVRSTSVSKPFVGLVNKDNSDDEFQGPNKATEKHRSTGTAKNSIHSVQCIDSFLPTFDLGLLAIGEVDRETIERAWKLHNA